MYNTTGEEEEGGREGATAHGQDGGRVMKESGSALWTNLELQSSERKRRQRQIFLRCAPPAGHRWKCFRKALLKVSVQLIVEAS